MKNADIQAITQYIQTNIDAFHTIRLNKLKALKLKEILKRKNPYLFRAKNILTANDLIKEILDAYLQSQEETLFGTFIEGVAIFVCKHFYNGVKSTLTGIDLEFNKNGIHYIVEIKSGPNWANSSQLKKLADNFTNAIALLSANGQKVEAINGCCYGKEDPNKQGYKKYCGQEFWTFISGYSDTYIKLIEPIGYQAKQKNDDFMISYAAIINTFTRDFITDFCDATGSIDWEKLLVFNSKK